MGLKVLVTSKSFAKMSQKPIEILQSNRCEITWTPYGPQLLSDVELANVIQGYDALLVGDDTVGEKTCETADKLKVISKHGVGIDNIDVASATRNGIVVTRAWGSNAESVADFTFALILGLARKLAEAATATKQGHWEPIKHMGCEVYGKTLGIIGLGTVGKRVAKRATGFSMEILYYDVVRYLHTEKQYGVQFVELEALLERSDIITLHVPLTESTTKLIGHEELKKMKKTAFLINTSRGKVVDEKALFKILNENKIAGAAVDVYSREPPGKDFPLFQLQNVLTTPHIASYTSDANVNMGTIAAEEIVRVLKREEPKYAVNYKEVQKRLKG